ncbi:MAG: hypothetical protein WDW36_000907 [Sanguina aurantia]
MSDADYLLASSALAAVKKLVAASGSRYQVFTRLPAASSVFFRDSDDTQHAYNALVPLPLSLGEIASRVKAKHYRSLQAAKHDMSVIRSNAALFHGAGSRYAEDAATFARTFLTALDRAAAAAAAAAMAPITAAATTTAAAAAAAAAGGGGGQGEGEGPSPAVDHAAGAPPWQLWTIPHRSPPPSHPLLSLPHTAPVPPDPLGVSVPRGHRAARGRPPLSPPPAAVPAVALSLTARRTPASPVAQRLRLRLPGCPRPGDASEAATSRQPRPPAQLPSDLGPPGHPTLPCNSRGGEALPQPQRSHSWQTGSSLQGGTAAGVIGRQTHADSSDPGNRAQHPQRGIRLHLPRQAYCRTSAAEVAAAGAAADASSRASRPPSMGVESQGGGRLTRRRQPSHEPEDSAAAAAATAPPATGTRKSGRNSTATRAGTKRRQSDSDGEGDERAGDDSAGDDAPKVRTSKRVAAASGGRRGHSRYDDADSDGDGGGSDESEARETSRNAGHGRRPAKRTGRHGSAVGSEDDSGGGESSSEDHSDGGRRGGRRSNNGTDANRRGGNAGRQREHVTRGRSDVHSRHDRGVDGGHEGGALAPTRASARGSDVLQAQAPASSSQDPPSLGLPGPRSGAAAAAVGPRRAPLKIKIRQGLDLNPAGTAPSTAAAAAAPAAADADIGASLGDSHNTGPASSQQPRPTPSTTAATHVPHPHPTRDSHPHLTSDPHSHPTGDSHSHPANFGSGPPRQGAQPHDDGARHGTGHELPLTAQHAGATGLGGMGGGGGGGTASSASRPTPLRLGSLSRRGGREGAGGGQALHRPTPTRAPVAMGVSQGGGVEAAPHGVLPLGMPRSVAGGVPGVGRLGGSLAVGEGGVGGRRRSGSDGGPDTSAVRGAVPALVPRQQNTRRSNSQQQQQQQQRRPQPSQDACRVPEEAAWDNPGCGTHGTACSRNASRDSRRREPVPEDHTPHQSGMGEERSEEAVDEASHEAVAGSGQVVSRSGRVSKPRVKD